MKCIKKFSPSERLGCRKEQAREGDELAETGDAITAGMHDRTQMTRVRSGNEREPCFQTQPIPKASKINRAVLQNGENLYCTPSIGRHVVLKLFCEANKEDLGVVQ